MEQLLNIIHEIHIDCFKLCGEALGKYLPIAGNVGVFCQSEKDYDLFTKIREEITYPSTNPNQKYYELKQPIITSPLGDVPQTVYTHLYVRKPSSDSPEVGDVDFVLADHNRLI